ncbi:hypothetical protein PspLS_02044 [Pyricularia sp. CBS 133598]|nr:hypothetical protein PspLS_02044 [Pyricularia sp. CBS 133598]
MTSSAEITSLPTGEPVPASTPPANAKKAAVPLSATLAAAPANVDAFLSHLHRCLQTPTGIDCVLQFVCYTSRLSAATLTVLGTNALRRSAKDIALLVLSLPSQQSAVLLTSSAAASPKTAASALALLVASRLRALGGLLAEARVAHRLWGLLGMYFWARRLIAASLQARRARKQQSSEKDVAGAQQQSSSAVVALQWAQLLSCAGFQLLENVAFLSSKGVLGWSPAEQAKLARWSSRFWGVFVGMEIGRLAFEATKGAEVRTAEWKKTMTRYVAWSPVIMHWQSEGGLLSELGVGMLGCIPSVIQMRDLWKSTATSA